MELVSLQERKEAKESRVPDEDVNAVLAILLEKQEQGLITDLMVGYINQETGNYETHLAAPTDVAMMNLGCDLLKNGVLSMLDYETPEDE